MTGPASVPAPKAGLWRIGRGDNPLLVRPSEPQTLGVSRSGNRFDSTSGDYGVSYFGSSLEVCFGETLARFRPSAALVGLLSEEWQEMGFMALGAVPAEWRVRRTAVRVLVSQDARFLDIESPHTHQHLRKELALGLASLGYSELDVGIVRGRDRRITRLVSEWAYHATAGEEDPSPVYAGIRYLSRISDAWECWAVFDDVELEVVETTPLNREMPELIAVGELFELTVF